ncbi:MAG: NAD(P)-binding domain-containing protein [Chthoniobacterales bacterium]
MANPLSRYTHWLHAQWPAGTVEKLPVSGENGLTNVPGVRIVGDLTGIPLLKFSSHTSADAVRAILEELRKADTGKRKEENVLDLAIIGAGVAGISAAIEAEKAALRFVVIEATEIFSTVVNFPKAKPIYTYPTEMKLDGGLQFTADVKEALLQEMEAQGRAAGIEITPGRVERMERKEGALFLHMGEGEPVRAPRDRGDQAKRKFPQAGRARRGVGQGLQPALRSEGVRGQERARRRRGRLGFGNGDRAHEGGREGHAQLSAKGCRGPGGMAGLNPDTRRTGWRISCSKAMTAR